MTSRRTFLTATAATAAVTGLGLTAGHALGAESARFDLPEPTGPFPVGVEQLHLVQPGRPDPWVPTVTRELMISVWYPARPCGLPRAPYLDPLVARAYAAKETLGLPAGTVDWAAPTTTARRGAPVHGRSHPVVLYTPGGGNTRAWGTIAVAELASRGFVVVTVDHTHETLVEFPGGRLVAPAIPENPSDLEAAKRLYMDAREADTVFVIAELDRLARGENPDTDGRELPAGLAGALDMSRLGIFGHSAGGLTASRVPRAEPRVRVAANLDGWYEFGENHPELGARIPFVFFGAASHPEQPPLYGEVRTHRTDPLWGQFWAATPGWKRDLLFRTGRHYTFTDAQWWLPQLPVSTDQIGTVNPPAATRAVRDYLVAIFTHHLTGRPQPLLDGPVPWFPVEFVE
jgi:hypothetical protein